MPQNGQMLSFTIGGRRVFLSWKKVEDSLRHVAPEPIKKYRVRIGGREYPIKQALSIAADVPIARFISTDAYRILSRLGFEVRS
jgi:hypothetical protein